MRGGRWHEPDGGKRKIGGGEEEDGTRQGDGNCRRKRMKEESKEYYANSSSHGLNRSIPKQEYNGTIYTKRFTLAS